MSANMKKIKTSLIATSILLPVTSTIVNADNHIEYKTITANSVNFRKGPSTSYDSMGKLNRGYKVEYIGKSGKWINIKYNGQVGYVHGDYVSDYSNNSSSDNNIKSIKIVTASSLNFRKGPSTSYSKIGRLSKGIKVGVISESNGWSKISYNGQVGYVSNDYLGTVNNTTPSTNNVDNNIKSTKVVIASSLNFRKGPSTSYSKIGRLSKGIKVGVISESNGWSKISCNGQVGYVSSKYLGEETSIENPSNEAMSSKADKVIDFAKDLLGRPYIWGAEGPSSFDCSGFTQYVFKKSVGVSIPRVSRDQSKFGQYINKGDLKKGDLIFFDTSGSNNGRVSHVGIYIGSNQFIHASSVKDRVVISSLSSYYNNAYVNARRVL